jgi:hypothetical protein
MTGLFGAQSEMLSTHTTTIFPPRPERSGVEGPAVSIFVLSECCFS